MTKRAPGLAAAVNRALAKEAPPTGPVPDVVRLTIYGHAKPSKRITEASKHSDEAKAYLAWQHLVEQYCLTVRPRPLPWQFFKVDMLFYFIPEVGNRITHGDRVNMGKSTEDGLAWGGLFPMRSGKQDDSRIFDGNIGIRWCKTLAGERVEVEIREFTPPEPVD